MSGISSVDGNNAALLQWLTQSTSQNEDPLLSASPDGGMDTIDSSPLIA